MNGWFSSLARFRASSLQLPRPVRISQEPFDPTRIDEGDDVGIVRVDLDELAVVAWVVAPDDQIRRNLRRLQPPEEETHEQRARIRHQLRFAVAGGSCKVPELLRIIVRLQKLAADQLGDGHAPQNDRFFTRGAEGAGEIERANVGPVGSRMPPPAERRIGYSQLRVQRDLHPGSIRRRRQLRDQLHAFGKIGDHFLVGGTLHRGSSGRKPGADGLEQQTRARIVMREHGQLAAVVVRAERA